MEQRVDPVSGNEVPPGALPEEVRDDVPAKLSEGEFVIPADIVRWYGLDYFNKLMDKAKEKIGESVEKGRVGGEGPEDELPFPKEELVAVDEQQAGPPGYAEGGQVAPQPQSLIKVFELPNGQLVFIPTVNGTPTVEVPAGAKEVGWQGGQSPQAPQPAPTGTQPPKEENDPDPDFDISPLAKDPSEWSARDFKTYADIQERRASGDLGQQAEDKFIGALTSMVPLGGLGLKARENYLSRTVPSQIDEMIKNGVDAAGNKLKPEDITMLSETRKMMEERAKATPEKKKGIGFSDIVTQQLGPMGLIGEALSKASKGLLGDKGTEPDRNSGPGSESDPFNYTGTQTEQRDDGSDYVTPTAENYGTLSSGGLYKKGGLVQRRNKK